jgi:antitoxin (DNA-binding transcriptional repressor) of toxin-antitoxin stability system
MKRTILAAALLVPALVLAQPRGAIVTDKVEAVVTVTKVDLKARTVTMRGPRGNLATLDVPPEAQNLDRVKPGDRVKVTYAEAAVIAITRGGEPTATVEEQVQLAPKGGTPGGIKVRTYQISAVVDAIDYKNRYVALRGPKGNTLALPVSKEVKNLESVKVGDKLTIAYTQALALELIPQETPKKPAAKKKS